MLSSFWKLKAEDWFFIVLFDLAVFYIGWSAGKASNKQD